MDAREAALRCLRDSGIVDETGGVSIDALREMIRGFVDWAAGCRSCLRDAVEAPFSILVLGCRMYAYVTTGEMPDAEALARELRRLLPRPGIDGELRQLLLDELTRRGIQL